MKKKRNIIIILILILSVEVTIAYLQSTDTFENIFDAGTYSVVTHEEFNSPNNWAPGDTTNKTITTTNEGTIPVRVRVKLEESWKDSNDEDLSLLSNGESVVIINFDNIDDWTKEGDYYYYMGELEPGESTTSLIQSVTFNPDYDGGVTCTYNSTTNSNECSSSNEYMGGTYTLNIITETVQADALLSAWNLSDDPIVSYLYSLSGVSAANNNNVSAIVGVETNLESIDKNIFLRYKITGKTITQTEVGLKQGNNVYYLKGAGATFNETLDIFNNDSIYYNENKETLFNAFGNNNCSEISEVIEDIEYGGTMCEGNINAFASSDGLVSISDMSNKDYIYECYVTKQGESNCHNLSTAPEPV